MVGGMRVATKKIVIKVKSHTMLRLPQKWDKFPIRQDMLLYTTNIDSESLISINFIIDLLQKNMV